MISVTGEPDRPGVRVGASLIDIGTGVWAALGDRRRAARARARPAAGARSTSRSSTRRSRWSAYQLTAALRTGVAPGRHGTAFPLIAPYEVFATADGELMIAAANDRLFRLLCERIGRPELADDPRFRTNPDRLAEPRAAAARDPRAARRTARPTGWRCWPGSRLRRCRIWPRSARIHRHARTGWCRRSTASTQSPRRCRSTVTASSTSRRRRCSASILPTCCASSGTREDDIAALCATE